MTFAQRRMLERLIAEPGSALAIETRERGGAEGPSFRGQFCHAPCPACRRSDKEPANWRVIFALTEAGFLKPQLEGTSYYTADGVTEAGRAALKAGAARAARESGR